MKRILSAHDGATGWNGVERFRGCGEVPLHETGFLLAEAAGRRMAGGMHFSWVPVCDESEESIWNL